MESFDLKALQESQMEFDLRHFDRNYSQHITPSMAKLNHICLHLGKLQGKLAAFLEEKRHGIDASSKQIIEEVILDMYIIAAQIANMFKVSNPSEAVLKRREENKRRINLKYKS